jgi:GrpB-like predicted nucleotidyltransferase (UPF0157 family)
MQDEVIIKPYNDEWPEIFEVLRSKIVNQIGAAINRMDPIGSTSRPITGVR